MICDFERLTPALCCREYHLFQDFQLQRLALRGVHDLFHFDFGGC